MQETGQPLKEMVVRTIESWKKILADRFDNSGYIYAVVLNEKSCIRYDLSDHRFFSSYEKAYDGLVSQKRYYLDDEDLRDIETFGEILRIKLNNDTNKHTHCDRYCFDNELKMIWVDGMRESLINEEGHKKSTIEDYIIYLPLPFQEGDIVKVESLFHETFYGVFPREWTKPEKVLHF